jgi:hypothetical protein
MWGTYWLRWVITYIQASLSKVRLSAGLFIYWECSHLCDNFQLSKQEIYQQINWKKDTNATIVGSSEDVEINAESCCTGTVKLASMIKILQVLDSFSYLVLCEVQLMMMFVVHFLHNKTCFQFHVGQCGERLLRPSFFNKKTK